MEPPVTFSTVKSAIAPTQKAKKIMLQKKTKKKPSRNRSKSKVDPFSVSDFASRTGGNSAHVFLARRVSVDLTSFLIKPPPIFRRSEPTPPCGPRRPVSQDSLRDLLALDVLGGRVEVISSNTRIRIEPRLMSLRGFGSISTNLYLLDSDVKRSGGGVGRRMTGSAVRISSGRWRGKVLLLFNIAFIQELSLSIGTAKGVLAVTCGSLSDKAVVWFRFCLLADLACSFRRASSNWRFLRSLFPCLYIISFEWYDGFK